MLDALLSQYRISFTPDELALITEALEQLGHNLLYAYDEVNSRKLEQAATLHEEIYSYLDSCQYV